MNILGISAFYHDAAAAVVKDGVILAAAQEERFSRKKHDPSFPTQAIKYCLEASGLSISELDAVVFYDKPFLKLERLLETYYAFAPKGLRSFIHAVPVWLKEKMFLKRIIRKELRGIEPQNNRQIKLLFPEHHLAHAASAFYPSPFETAAILTIDGVGEWATASICLGEGNQITVLREMQFPHSLGLLYAAFTYFLGFKVNSGEYKLMGLAPYGDPSGERVSKYLEIIRTHLATLKPDGSVWLNQDYFSYATGLRMVPDQKWALLFGFPRRVADSELEQHHCDLALAIQLFTEEVVLKMAQEAQRLTGVDYLCMAGGVALNCVANGKLHEAGVFKEIFIQPAAGDAGGAIGAALGAYHIYFGQERTFSQAGDSMQGALLGPDIEDFDVERMARQNKAAYTHFQDFHKLCDYVATQLGEGKVVGWMQGRMEFGPRALGNRSILGDPRDPEMQRKINLKIKFRESFRPFAPAVLAEVCQDYFELEGASPYMLLVKPVVAKRRSNLPETYHALPIREKLAYLRSDIPAVTHVDFSARIQTVHQEVQPKFWQLIRAFKQQTDCGLLINTSFNVRGEPIVCTPEEGYQCFMKTEMDSLVIGDYVFEKDS